MKVNVFATANREHRRAILARALCERCWSFYGMVMESSSGMG